MSPLANLIYKLTDLAWETAPRAAKYASKKTARDLGIHGKLTSTPTGVYRANGQFIPHVGEVFTAPAKYGAMLLGGPGALGATLGAMYADEMMDRANQVAKDPNSALANQYREDALNENGLPDLEILNTLRNRVGKRRTATPAATPAPTAPVATPDLNTWNDDWDHMSFRRVASPVTRRRGKARTANIVSTPAPAVQETQAALSTAPVGAIPARDYSGILISPAQLTPEELNAPESADLAFNRGIHTTVQAPQFSNDDLAVYDWQTGKPRLDAFGYQIRSADPRDHVGDPRWGANGQGLTPEQAEELDWYYRN